MVEIEGDFEGEIKVDPIKFHKILKKTVIKNNDSSGKVQVPHDYINKEVVILLPKIKVKK